jgi:hypothetical protein
MIITHFLNYQGAKWPVIIISTINFLMFHLEKLESGL